MRCRQKPQLFAVKCGPLLTRLGNASGLKACRSRAVAEQVGEKNGLGLNANASPARELEGIRVAEVNPVKRADVKIISPFFLPEKLPRQAIFTVCREVFHRLSRARRAWGGRRSQVSQALETSQQFCGYRLAVLDSIFGRRPSSGLRPARRSLSACAGRPAFLSANGKHCFSLASLRIDRTTRTARKAAAGAQKNKGRWRVRLAVDQLEAVGDD